MANTASKFYSVMVVGDNPQELMEKYKIGLKVDKYLKYRYLDAEKMQKNSIKIFEQILNDYKAFNLTKFQTDTLAEKLKAIKNMTPFEYYQTVTYGCSYDENGDAYSEFNPNGKWNTYRESSNFSVPLITVDGKETTSGISRNINWNLLHMADASIYELVWEMVKEGKEPTNDEEKRLYDNMVNREAYFAQFKDKETYVAHNAAYWNYAYLDENGWIDIDDEKGKDIDWISNYYKRFISKLKGTDRVTIFEFTRNSDDIEEF